MDDARLARTVEAHFGPVFDGPGSAELRLEGWVQPQKAGGGFHVQLRVSHGTRLLGSRTLEASEADCSDLTRPLLLVIALLLDPERSWTGQFPAIFADAPASPGAVLLDDLPESAPAPPALVEASVAPPPPSAQAPRERDSRAAAAGEPRPKRARPWDTAIQLGGGYGGAAGWTMVLEPFLQFRAWEAWWLRVAAPLWIPSFPGNMLHVDGYGGRLEACRRLLERGRKRVAACLGAGATFVRLETTVWDGAFTGPPERGTTVPHLSAQLTFERDFSRWGMFAASMGAQGNLSRARGVESLPDEELRVVFLQPPVGFWWLLGMGAHF